VRVGPPFVEMCFDCGDDQCCGLRKVGMVVMVGFCQVMWFVILESTKERILGVDPPRTTCATTCPVWNNLLTN
jgi:hypothetical protein